MSIVIALGVTTPETSYSDMAAGSDPESVEASPAVNEKNYSNHSCGSAQSHGYRGLPYAMQQSSVVCCQDHNYGAPPPPTPPASPLSQTIIPRMELNGVVCGPRYHPHDDDDNSADSDSSSEDGGVGSWCQCTCSLRPDGFLIECKSCRGLDRRKGVEGQRRKPENVSVGESSATESGDEEVSPASVSYTATQHTPTSITLTVNRVKRNKSKKRKKSTEKARGAPKGKKVKAFREGSRKSMRMKNSTTDGSTVDENTTEGWESKIRQWTDQYEDALANQYSADVQTLLQLHRAANANVAAAVTKATSSSPPPEKASASLDSMDTINRTELACNNTVLGSQMQLGRVTRVQKHRKILRAAKDLEPDTLIIEYRGKVMLKQQFEVNGHFFKKPYPFVLFYSKFNEVEMCVDARTFGNDARFIRRSCTPNAEVRHVIAEGMIHLCIYAISQISKDAEVTVGFDYEFNSCNYKVDCACHKGNQNCPVLKHNLSPRETLLCPPAAPSPSSLAGAETRRRKARRREMEVGGPVPLGTSDDSNQPPEEPGEARDLQGGSDLEESLLDGVKLEEGEEGELDENGVLLSSRRSREERKAETIMHVFENLDKRKRRTGSTLGTEDVKPECPEPEEGGGNSAGGPPAPHSTGVGVSTRRTTYVTEPSSSVEFDKPLASAPSSSMALSLPAPAKPPPARSTKPRPKSRISRYRSSSSQRARRQRQALAQQAAAAAAAEQGPLGVEEGPQGPPGVEPALGDATLGAGQLLDGDLGSTLNKNLRYPKTKKYLVTEWLNDKVSDKSVSQAEVLVERPLRITTDPTVLATTLNMLPGLAQSPLICTAPKHYVRFGSPFNPERRRPRPLNLDGTYGCYKKRWIQQAQEESCSASLEDGTESTSSHQSTSSSSTPNPLSTDLAAPIKKRRAKYVSEVAAPPHEDLLRPLSPISPPLPEDPLHPLLTASCAALLLGTHPHHHHHLAEEEEGTHPHHHHLTEEEEEGHRPNGLAYSPLPSLPTSRCNTPLQFENISSPEASPVHRPESVSPEPCLRTDLEVGRPQFTDISLSSGGESPSAAVISDDLSLSTGVLLPQDPQGGPVSALAGSLTPAPGTPSDPALSREAAFRTEFNLIYTCSPLNANLGGSASAADRRLSQSEGSFSPAESFYSAVSGQGLLAEAPGSMSPYGEPHYGGGYPDSGTPPHTSNPPQKKKVSLLEYRKRMQGSSRDAEPGGGGSSLGGGGNSLGTPTRPGCLGLSRAESPGGLRPNHQHHLLPPASSSSPHSSFSSPAHPSSAIPLIEDVSPPADHRYDSSQTSGPAPPAMQQGSSHWMVPTTVERLREGQGVLERVLRGSRLMKRTDGWAGDKDSDADRYEIQMGMASPMKSPHRYSPSVYAHQVSSETESPAFLQQSASSSPFRGSYSPSAMPPASQGFYPRLSSHHPGLSQDPSPQTHTPPAPYPRLSSHPALSQDPSPQTHNLPASYSNQTTSAADSALCGASRPPGGALQQSSSSLGASHMYSGSHLKASLLNSGLSGSPTLGSRAHGHPKTDSAAATGISPHTSRLSQQPPAPRGLRPGSPGQAVLQAGSRLLQASGAQHYPSRGTPLSQFHPPPLTGSGVRTQSGSF